MARKRVPRASAEFEGADLGDERLTKRLKKTAETFAASPASSLPRATANESELEGLGRFKNGTAQGFFGHYALAIAADGSREPLGLVGLRTIVRPFVHGTVTP